MIKVNTDVIWKIKKKKKKDVIWKDGKSIVTVISCENIGKNICTKIQWA